LLTGFPPPRGLGAGKGCCSPALLPPPFRTKLSSFLSPLDRSRCESPALAAENIADGLSGLPHRFRARACGEASAAASNGSSDTDRAWRGAWACAGSCSGRGVLAPTSIAGRSCTRGVRSLAGAAAPPVPVPRFRNGLGVAHSPNSASAPRLFRLWWCGDGLAGLPAAPPPPPVTVLLLGSAAASLLGVLGMDSAGGGVLLA